MLETGFYISLSGGNSLIYVITYSKLSLLYCNEIRAGGVA